MCAMTTSNEVTLSYEPMETDLKKIVRFGSTSLLIGYRLQHKLAFCQVIYSGKK
jgi:hypothetical protein